MQVCQVHDAAEFCRNSHTSPAWRKAAQETCSALGGKPSPPLESRSFCWGLHWSWWPLSFSFYRLLATAGTPWTKVHEVGVRWPRHETGQLHEFQLQKHLAVMIGPSCRAQQATTPPFVQPSICAAELRFGVVGLTITMAPMFRHWVQATSVFSVTNNLTTAQTARTTYQKHISV